jgi:hypothetical protein
MSAAASNQPAQYRRSPLSERGGTLSTANQHGSNFMQYSAGGSYDDHAYSSFASSNYSQGEATISKSDPAPSDISPHSGIGYTPDPRLEAQRQPPPGFNYHEQLQQAQGRPGVPLGSPSLGIPAGIPTRPPSLQSQPNQPGAVAGNASAPGPGPSPGSDNYYVCPMCRGLAVRVCGCRCRETTCPSGHTWHLENGMRRPGASPAHAGAAAAADRQA